MRGKKKNLNQIFSYVSLEERIPQRHPLRKIRKIVDTALIQILFSILSKRLLMEEPV